jgi:MFS family permease
MHKSEIRAAFSLSTLFTLRMLGLFIVLPIFTPYAKNLTGASPFLIGMAFGIYGLTQALFQLPLGTLSDYFPRKSIIALGFCLFILGSFVCAYSHSIWGMMLGRALQGMGAVGSTLTALLTDFVRPEMRSKSMAILGIMIALSFFIAIILGPFLGAHIGIKGIFMLTGILGIFAIGLLFSAVPKAPKRTKNNNNFQQNFMTQFKRIFFHSQLSMLNIGIFCLHIMLTATFMVIPLWITQWSDYLWPLILSFVFTFILIGLAEKNKKVFALYFYAITGLIFAEIGLSLFHAHSLFLFFTSLTLFLLCFNLLEANLPSLVSRITPFESKGTAMGLFSTFQFMGIFCGGLLGGLIEQYSSSTKVLLSCAVLSFLWLILTLIIRYLRRDSWQEV